MNGHEKDNGVEPTLTWGTRLRLAREHANLKPAEMAEKLATEGIEVTANTVRAWERGDNVPRRADYDVFIVTAAWSRITGVREGWLLNSR